MKCTQCSADNSDSAKFCTKCGHGFRATESAGPIATRLPGQTAPPPAPETPSPGSSPPRQAAQSNPGIVESRPGGLGIGAKIAIGALATLAALFLLGLLGQFNNSSDTQVSQVEAPVPVNGAGPVSETEPAPATGESSPAGIGDQGPAEIDAAATTPLDAGSHATSKPSFDCSIAVTQSEKLICSDEELSELDVRLSRAYSLARNRAADGQALRAMQVHWMKTVRDECSDVVCLSAAMSERAKELESQ